MAAYPDPVAPLEERLPDSGPARERARVARLEADLGRAVEERAHQSRMVREELDRLSKIYDRLRADLAGAQGERDQALEDARRERELRARETLELAEQLEEARQNASSPAAAGAEESRARFVEERLRLVPEERRELAPGELPELEGFRIIEEIGRGGMATVFRAENKADGETVAIKLLHEGSKANRTRTELFLREAAVMLQLDHPALLRAIDAGDCRYGRYLVLPLVRGRSLAARARREGPLGEEESVRIALEIGRALRYCARIGLTHRDVKPSNIMQDEEGRVRLCDFGLAALDDGDSGRPYGSPGYAAPEQLSTPDEVDERADIYALGCSLWHLVVGRRPFPGSPRKSFEEARRNDVPDPRFEGADVSRRLAQVIRRMTRCKRTRRYRNWDECLLDLMLVEKGNPPFAAHLADALAPELRHDGAGAVPPVAPIGGTLNASPPLTGESGQFPSPVRPSITATGTGEQMPEERTAFDRLSAALRGAEDAAGDIAVPDESGGSESGLVKFDNALARLLDVAASHRGLLVTVALAFLLIGLLAGAQFGGDSTVSRLRDEAIVLASRGEGREAAASLRAAARLVSSDEAEELLQLARELEK